MLFDKVKCALLLGVISAVSAVLDGETVSHAPVAHLKVDKHNLQKTRKDYDAVAKNTEDAMWDARLHAYDRLWHIGTVTRDVHHWRYLVNTPDWHGKYGGPTSSQEQLWQDHVARQKQLEEYLHHFAWHGDDHRVSQAEGHLKANGLIAKYSKIYPLDHLNYRTGKASQEALDELDNKVAEVKHYHPVLTQSLPEQDGHASSSHASSP